MPVNINKYELRLARAQHRLAKIELRKAEVDAMASEPHNLADVVLARTLASRIAFGVVALAFTIAVSGCVDGTMKYISRMHTMKSCVDNLTRKNITGRCYIKDDNPVAELNKVYFAAPVPTSTPNSAPTPAPTSR